jgi:Transport and Golgi organisation 2
MCTVTAVPRAPLATDPSPDPLLLRVACNRDELLNRQPALPPTLWAAGRRRAVMPIDPESGGTWIAANDAGLVFVVLNSNPGFPVHAGDLSRGTIIPTLVGCATTSRALAHAQRLQAGRFAPFRLLIIDRYGIVDCWPDGGRIRHRRAYLHSAILRTSSGLGDALVAGPRRTLFRRVFNNAHDFRHAQDSFHRHHWPGRQAISVNMRRDDARTVSQTIVEVRSGSVALSYRAVEWPHAVAIQVAA